MTREIDARGLACPQPVINTKNALNESDSVTVIVDNESARGNVRRFAENTGCSVDEETRNEGIYLYIKKGDTHEMSESEAMKGIVCDLPADSHVVVLSSSFMGRGDDELGSILMRSYLHTLGELSSPPNTLILINSGVKLAVEGSDVLDDIRTLEDKGTVVLVCGTCLNYFQLEKTRKIGLVSNMYDIAEAMSGADRCLII